MKPSFCDFHMAAFLSAWEGQPLPLDQALSRYFKSHRSLGAHDRRTIGDTLFGMLRWKGLIDHLAPSASVRQRLALFQSLDLAASRQDLSIPEHARWGVSPFLHRRLIEVFGHAEAERLAALFQQSAPTTIRVNSLKISRDALLARWAEKFDASPCPRSPDGIRFRKREPLFALPEFKQGLFEVQDEGSQLVANLVGVLPGQQALDYCAGSGGKTLAFAPKMQGKGQIFLHDIRPSMLNQARLRLRRAGIQNAQCRLPSVKNQLDWVLADVPCSGTGTLRRNPERKWTLDEPMVLRLVELQRQIFAEALEYVRPGGKIVYATCSILPEENQDQVKHFLSLFPVSAEGEPSFWLPEEGGMDGFFAVVLKKIS